MKLEEARAAINMELKCPEIVVETRSGARYAVAWDIIQETENGAVYGYRINGSRGGPFSKQERNGSIRWFDLCNVKFIESRSGDTR